MIKSHLLHYREKLHKNAFRFLKSLYYNIFPTNKKPGIIFVSGVPRSGTNMMMDLLDRNWKTQVFHESDSRAFSHYQLKDIETIKNLVDISRSEELVFKALLDSHRLADLMSIFQPSTAIWMFRDYKDVVNSIIKRWPNGRNRLEEIVFKHQEGTWRSEGLTEKTYRIIVEKYREDLDNASAHALFWFYRNQLFFDQGFDNRQDITLIKYEDFIRHPLKYKDLIRELTGIKLTKYMVSRINTSPIGKGENLNIDPAIADLCDKMLEKLNNQWKFTLI